MYLLFMRRSGFQHRILNIIKLRNPGKQRQSPRQV